ncbi:glycosyltransferase [Alphaproteobacteria bacterium]|nr:glycosyltransferase [Alphaproteobacteria bacterium]
MKKIYFITYDLTARGGISYYARALIPALKKKEPNLVIIELKQKNRWHRLASLLVCSILAPKGALIISNHVNFLRAFAPLKRLKKFSLSAITINREIEHPSVIPMLRKVDHLFPMFYHGQARLEALGVPSENISHINNILEQSGQPSTDIKPEHQFLVIARLDKFDAKIKGFFYLLRALRQCKNIRVVIAGSGDSKELLEAYCQRFNIQDQVSFRGFVDDKEKISLMRAASVFVHLSDGEGVPCITVMEAIEQGCRILVHDDPRGDVNRLVAKMPLVPVNRYKSSLLADTLRKEAKKQKSKTEITFAKAKNSINHYSAENVVKVIATKMGF